MGIVSLCECVRVVSEHCARECLGLGDSNLGLVDDCSRANKFALSEFYTNVSFTF